MVDPQLRELAPPLYPIHPPLEGAFFLRFAVGQNALNGSPSGMFR